MKHIILIGLPNSGKSTLGKKAAEALNMSFFDTDKMIMEKIEKANLHPSYIFTMMFSGRFYTEQIEIVKKPYCLEEGAIIATGAEVALIPECASLLTEMGTVILLKRDVQIMLEDLADKEKYPNRVIMTFDDGEAIDTSVEVVKEYAKESEEYEKIAHKVFENNSDEETAVKQFIKFIENIMQPLCQDINF
jgi:shikimate kinase